MADYEKQGTAYDSGATEHERVGRELERLWRELGPLPDLGRPKLHPKTIMKADETGYLLADGTVVKSEAVWPKACGPLPGESAK